MLHKRMSGYQGAYLCKHFNVSGYYTVYFVMDHLQAYSKLRQTLPCISLSDAHSSAYRMVEIILDSNRCNITKNLCSLISNQEFFFHIPTQLRKAT